MKNKGFTLIEMMISLVVGAFVLAGVMFTYMSMKTTTKATMEIGELQESGRLAMDILAKDIERAGFWGTYYAETLNYDDLTLISAPPAPPTVDCAEGENNSSFPVVSTSNFRYLYGKVVSNANELICITTATPGTDLIQVKGVFGNNFENVATNTANYYLISNKSDGQLISGTGAVVNLPNSNSSIWQYDHHMYYISQLTGQKVNGKSITIPTLMRKRLTTVDDGSFIDDVIMEGVEDMRLIYGIDTTRNDRVDTYKTTSQMQDEDWEQSGTSIISVQIFLLIRSLEQDFSSPAINRTFTLGGSGTSSKQLTFNDQYKRTLFVSTVRITNGGMERW
jgi:type IV pilus assembly protein PilW